MQYQYPIEMSFKLLALGPQIYIRDAGGRDIFYVHQKAFKLKEDVGVFSSKEKAQQLYNIQADRIIDFSAAYTITDMAGTTLGKIKREGVQSLFKASYLIFDPGEQQSHHITEDNGWVRVADGVMQSIPLIGMFSGYLFHPSYTVVRVNSNTPVMRLTKQPAFFESSFKIEMLNEFESDLEETRLLLSFMMMILLERARG